MKFVESANLELKREFTEEIKKEVVAFANTAGGVIYIGINDDGSIRGIENIDKELLRVANCIRFAIKPDVSMFVSYSVENIEEKDIIRVTVQRGNARPYYISGKGPRSQGVYIRQGAACIPASEEAIFKMSRESFGERYEEIRSFNQKLTFAALGREFAGRNLVFTKRDKKRLKLITEEGLYTNLALLLSDQCIHTIKAAVFEGVNKNVFKDRREFSGSLLQQLNDVYSYIDIHNGLRAETVGLYRKENRNFPSSAVREALLNAIVHRDYSFSASIIINIFDDRMEIISVGGLVEGLNRDDILLGVSAARNANLCKVFYRLMLIEAFGSGLTRIFQCYDQEGEKHIQPEISVSDNAFRLVLPNVNYKKTEK